MKRCELCLRNSCICGSYREAVEKAASDLAAEVDKALLADLGMLHGAEFDQPSSQLETNKRLDSR